MVGFFVKKAFFDGWDNLFQLAAFNAVHLALFSLLIVLPAALGGGTFIMLACGLLGVAAISVWQAVCVEEMNEAAEYKSPSFRKALGSLKKVWVPGLISGGIFLLVGFSLTVGIPFYLLQKNIFGMAAASLLFWMSVAAILTMQYFQPLMTRRGGGIKANLKASITLFLDNPGFSFFLFFHSAISLGLSLVVAFLAPGPAGIALGCSDAVKLRIKKYEWLEAHPGANRKKIPWAELLAEDKELVGTRTIKGMIFPWKDGK
jgi:hypothetical protein